MSITKAIQRIGWRLSKGTFTPNENDITAFNTIAEHFNESQEQQYRNNQAFAKLYIHVYGVLLKHYKTTVIDNIARKQVNKILSKSITELVQDFTYNLNNSEFYELMQDAGIDLSTQTTKLSAQKEKEVSILQEKIKEPENALKLVGDVWKEHDVLELLKIEINHALNLHR